MSAPAAVDADADAAAAAATAVAAEPEARAAPLLSSVLAPLTARLTPLEAVRTRYKHRSFEVARRAVRRGTHAADGVGAAVEDFTTEVGSFVEEDTTQKGALAWRFAIELPTEADAAAELTLHFDESSATVLPFVAAVLLTLDSVVVDAAQPRPTLPPHAAAPTLLQLPTALTFPRFTTAAPLLLRPLAFAVRPLRALVLFAPHAPLRHASFLMDDVRVVARLITWPTAQFTAAMRRAPVYTLGGDAPPMQLARQWLYTPQGTQHWRHGPTRAQLLPHVMAPLEEDVDDDEADNEDALLRAAMAESLALYAAAGGGGGGGGGGAGGGAAGGGGGGGGGGGAAGGAGAPSDDDEYDALFAVHDYTASAALAQLQAQLAFATPYMPLSSSATVGGADAGRGPSAGGRPPAGGRPYAGRGQSAAAAAAAGAAAADADTGASRASGGSGAAAAAAAPATAAAAAAAAAGASAGACAGASAGL